MSTDTLQQVVAEMRASDSAGFIRIGAWAKRIEAIAASAQVREPQRRCPYCTGRIYTDAGCQNCKVGTTHPKPAAEPCVICCADEPYTGTCGSSDPRALCNKPAAEPVPVAQGDDLIERLRALARHDHSDTSIADEAADTIADHARREAEWKEVARKNRDGFEEYERRYYLEVNAREDLAASLAACRADAERYRLLRVMLGTVGRRRSIDFGGCTPEKLDAALDTALADAARSQP